MSNFKLSDLNFGDIDAKNEVLKEARKNNSAFFENYSIPDHVNFEDLEIGAKYFVLGLKGTGKTALLRYSTSKSSQKT